MQTVLCPTDRHGRHGSRDGSALLVTSPPAAWTPLPAAATALIIVTLSASPVSALDCTQARSVPDEAICGDAGAMAADKAMSESFTRLRGRLDARQAAALLADQRQWPTQRNGTCADDKGGPAARARRRSESRAQALDAKPLSGSGTPDALVPVIVNTAGTKKADFPRP